MATSSEYADTESNTDTLNLLGTQEGGDARTRKLTEKGNEMFQSQYNELFKKQDECWKKIEDVLITITTGTLGVKELRQLQKDNEQVRSMFEVSAEELLQFLERSRTEESENALRSYNEHLVRRKKVMTQISTKIQGVLLDAAEQLSEASTGSKASSLTKKRIKAEVERAKLEILKHKVDLQFEKAKIEGKMQILDQKETTALADAEVKVLELEEKDSPYQSVFDDPPLSTEAQVQDYLENLNLDDVGTGPTTHEPTPRQINPSSLNPHASTFISSAVPVNPRSLPTEQSAIHNDHFNAFSNFLMKKELLISRFSSFTDEPEAYNAWKMNFQSVVRELTISKYEELQLLVRWLGPESARFAANIQQASAENPTEGVRAVWARLDERYGAAELIDSALKTKISKFPPLTIKDSKRLFELSDLLCQLESVKKNPRYTAILSYYDPSVGILPIINKLPYQWREKWTTRAYNYKTKHDVSYPPFNIFVQFIQDLSRVRNDPGFQYEDLSQNRRPSRRNDVGHFVSRKTQMESGKYQRGGATKKCPLHDEPHSLSHCKRFRTLPLPTRKKIIKENNLCYRCCCGTHMARECRTQLRCEVCSSTFHHTALHPTVLDGGEPKRKPYSRETRDHANVQVNNTVGNMCTRVCGEKFGGKSRAKTLLVNVYPKGHKDKIKRMYAILDDQSSQTLARPQFFNSFGIDNETITYTLSSCSGSVTNTGRCGRDFVVEPVQDGKPIRLTRVIECTDIPSNREEIPTPKVASSFHHLKESAMEIPEIDNSADILLLIGRDHPDAHHVFSQLTGPVGSPFAQKLSLGWAIMLGNAALEKYTDLKL